MTGSIVHRGKNRWALVLDLGHVVRDDGTRKRQQKWISFRGTKKQADAKLIELVGAANGGTFVEPSKLTLIVWLRAWLEKSVRPMRRPETARVYASMINTHVAKSTIANVPLQQLRGSDLERFYAQLKLAPSSVAVCHAVIHRALKKAVKDRLLALNPAVDLERLRPSKDPARGARLHCWSTDEARRFIQTAATCSPQTAAFMYLALDTGARKSELAGLCWSDVDLDAATVTIARQLDSAGAEPTFGVTKTGRARTVTLSPETVAQLGAHRRAQATLKMANRKVYKDFGLVFAKEPEDLQTPTAALGQPIATLSGARFKKVVTSAGVKPIKFHGLRHTSATLLLGAGLPVHVVAERLGHASATLTLSVYAHVMPNMQQDAAARLGRLLHG